MHALFVVYLQTLLTELRVMCRQAAVTEPTSYMQTKGESFRRYLPCLHIKVRGREERRGKWHPWNCYHFLERDLLFSQPCMKFLCPSLVCLSFRVLREGGTADENTAVQEYSKRMVSISQ